MFPPEIKRKLKPLLDTVGVDIESLSKEEELNLFIATADLIQPIYQLGVEYGRNNPTDAPKPIITFNQSKD